MGVNDNTIPCTECQAGLMHRKYVTYFTWLGDDLITVPDFPSWVCDVCGRREYDFNALNQLSLLLSAAGGRKPLRARKVRKKTVTKKNPRPTRPE